MSYANPFNSCQAQDFLQELRRAVEKAQRSPDQVILDETDLCEMLHISKRHAADLRAEGKLRYAKDGGKLYYKLSWVLDYIDRYAIKIPDSLLQDVRKVCRSY